MCLAYPGKILKIKGDQATVDYGVETRVAKIVEGEFHKGDYVIVQGRLVIEKVDPDDARQFIEMVQGASGTR